MDKPLGDLSRPLRDAQEPAVETEEQSALVEFGRTALYTAKQSALGLTQGLNRLNGIVNAAEPGNSEAPAAAKSVAGQHAQMFGAAIGGFVPTVIAAATAKFGIGKLVAREAGREAGLAMSAPMSSLMGRTGAKTMTAGPLGFNLVESGTAGFIYGSAFTPTDNDEKADFQSFLADRSVNGLKGMISFSAFTGLSMKLASPGVQALAGKVNMDQLVSSRVGNAVVAGLPAGVVNAELESLHHQAKLTGDLHEIGSSAYQMAVTGLAFSGTSAAFTRISEFAKANEQTQHRTHDTSPGFTDRFAEAMPGRLASFGMAPRLSLAGSFPIEIARVESSRAKNDALLASDVTANTTLVQQISPVERAEVLSHVEKEYHSTSHLKMAQAEKLFDSGVLGDVKMDAQVRRVLGDAFEPKTRGTKEGAREAQFYAYMEEHPGKMRQLINGWQFDSKLSPEKAAAVGTLSPLALAAKAVAMDRPFLFKHDDVDTIHEHIIATRKEDYIWNNNSRHYLAIENSFGDLPFEKKAQLFGLTRAFENNTVNRSFWQIEDGVNLKPNEVPERNISKIINELDQKKFFEVLNRLDPQQVVSKAWDSKSYFSTNDPPSKLELESFSKLLTAYKVATVFGDRAHEYLSSPVEHDLSQLPYGYKKAFVGLGDWILKNGTTEGTKVSLVGEGWNKLSPEMKALPAKTLVKELEEMSILRERGISEERLYWLQNISQGTLNLGEKIALKTAMAIQDHLETDLAKLPLDQLKLATKGWELDGILPVQQAIAIGSSKSPVEQASILTAWKRVLDHESEISYESELTAANHENRQQVFKKMLEATKQMEPQKIIEEADNQLLAAKYYQPNAPESMQRLIAYAANWTDRTNLSLTQRVNAKVFHDVLQQYNPEVLQKAKELNDKDIPFRSLRSFQQYPESQITGLALKIGVLFDKNDWRPWIAKVIDDPRFESDSERNIETFQKTLTIDNPDKAEGLGRWLSENPEYGWYAQPLITGTWEHLSPEVRSLPPAELLRQTSIAEEFLFARNKMADRVEKTYQDLPGFYSVTPSYEILNRGLGTLPIAELQGLHAAMSRNSEFSNLSNETLIRAAKGWEINGGFTPEVAIAVGEQKAHWKRLAADQVWQAHETDETTRFPRNGKQELTRSGRTEFNFALEDQIAKGKDFIAEKAMEEARGSLPGVKVYHPELSITDQNILASAIDHDFRKGDLKALSATTFQNALDILDSKGLYDKLEELQIAKRREDAKQKLDSGRLVDQTFPSDVATQVGAFVEGWRKDAAKSAWNRLKNDNREPDAYAKQVSDDKLTADGQATFNKLLREQISEYQKSTSKKEQEQQKIDAGRAVDPTFPLDLARMVGDFPRGWRQETARLAWAQVKGKVSDPIFEDKMSYAAQAEFNKTIKSLLKEMGKTHEEFTGVQKKQTESISAALINKVAHFTGLPSERAEKLVQSFDPDIIELALVEVEGKGVKSLRAKAEAMLLKNDGFDLRPRRVNGEDENADVWQHYAALRLVQSFQERSSTWLSKMAEQGVNAHDAVIWLPNNSPEQLKGLDNWLLDPQISNKVSSELTFTKRTLNDDLEPVKSVETMEGRTALSIVASRWHALTAQERALPIKELIVRAQANSYSNVTDQGFADISAKLGVSPGNEPGQFNYNQHRYLTSLKTESPFPTTTAAEAPYKSGDYVGFFAPRSWAPGVYLGELSGCCQHPNGVAHTSAWHGQESPDGGFFVIVDPKRPGKVVSESWARVTPRNGVSMDSVEGFLVNENNRDHVAKIYELAATDLVKNKGFRTVTASDAGNAALNLSRWPEAKQHALESPLHFTGYTDMKDHNQKLLAHEPSNSEINANASRSVLWVRGAAVKEMKEFDGLLSKVYPAGDQHISDGDFGYILNHKKDGAIGFAVLDVENKQINDLAVAPNHRIKGASTLIKMVMDKVKEEGGTWSADARESTSFKLLKRLSQKGLINVQSSLEKPEIVRYMGNKEPVYKVVFEPIQKPEITKQVD